MSTRKNTFLIVVALSLALLFTWGGRSGKAEDHPSTPTGLTVTDTGTGGQLSSEVSDIPSDSAPPPPPPPGSLKVSDPGTGGRLELSWGPSTDLVGYYLYRDTGPGSNVERMGPFTGTTYVDTGVADGIAYTYRVTAVDSDGNESAPATDSGTSHDITPPTPPLGLAVTDLKTGTELQLSWNPSPEQDLAGYNIYRDTAADGKFAIRINDSLLTGSLNENDKGLTRNTTYYYKIQAVDTTGNASALSVAVAGTPVDKTPPASPAGLSIVDLYTGTDLALSWTPNTIDSDGAGYNVYRATASTGPFSKLNSRSIAFTATGYKDTTAPRHVTSYYYVTAVDQSDNERGEPGTVVSIQPVDRTPPAVPQILGPGDPGTGTKLIPSWTANTESDVRGYNLYKSSSRDGPYLKINSEVLPGTSYADSAVTVGTLCWYRVSAIDWDGNESGGSEVMSGTPTDRVPPSAPLIVTVTDRGVGGGLRINWNPSAETDTAGYNIYYGSTPDGPYLKANTTLVTAPPFDHNGLTDGIVLYYRVTAQDGDRNESSQSPATGGSVGTPTDQTPPQILYTTPTAGEAAVGTGQSIKVTFDRPMLASSITTAVFSITSQEGGAVAAAAASYSASTRTATFTMPALTANQTYTATVTTEVKNAFGVPTTAAYAWSFTTGSSTSTSPHGLYLSDTNTCSTCHSTHVAAGPKILSRSNESVTCFFCHDGTAAQSNVASSFATGSGDISLHPVRDTPAVANGSIRCSDCHNPHGERKDHNTLYPKLLRAPDLTHEGNGFCLACHGNTNRHYTPTYYAATAGDHTRAGAVHYDLTKAAMVPSSGTQVTCVQCHEKHGSSTAPLLKGAEEKACFACHNSGANSMTGRNIQSEFSQASRHDITGATGAKVECSSCHGPHTVDNVSYAAGQPSSQISNPANTKQDFSAVASSAQGYVRMTEFCLACHKNPASSPLPAAGTGPATEVPYSILFQSRSVTSSWTGASLESARQGWDKSGDANTHGYKSSVHYSKGMSCLDCHNSHASPNELLLTRPEDNRTTPTQGVCGKCHLTSTPPISGAPNILPDMQNGTVDTVDAYKHPTLDTAGKHADTEDYATVNNFSVAAMRHAECVDCHDPHSAKAYANTVAPPNVPDQIRQVSGVSVTNWPAANTFGDGWAPGIGSGSPTFKAVNPITQGWQLCLKCHSYYSYRSSPPTPGGAPYAETDQAKEFNPNNESFHGVIAASPLSSRTYVSSGTRIYGQFATATSDPATKDSQGNPWTGSSRLICEDCHRSAATNLRGPHGSSVKHILRNPWIANPSSSPGGSPWADRGGTGAAKSSTGGTNDSSGDLCFQCHDYRFYGANGGNNGRNITPDPGSTTSRSGFSNVAAGKYNLHGQEHGGIACTACHVLVPHGWNQRALLGNLNPATGGQARTAPYNASSFLHVNTWKSSGSWTQADCAHECHTQ